MEIVRLPEAERAPDDVDCISINRAPSGNYQLLGSVLQPDGASVSIISDRDYATAEDAEAAGLAWLEDHGSQRAFVSHGG